MNWDQIEGKWKQYAGQLIEKWGRLTENDLKEIAGKRDQLIGKIQERYGIAKEEVERQIEEFSRSLKTSSSTTPKEEDKSKSRGAGR
jgi:uncharacterized protein YjbJ (UPF0337 family)